VQSRPDDKGAMASKHSLAIALVALSCLTLVSSASAAIGLAQQRGLTKPQRSAAARTATASPLLASPASCPGQSDPSAPAVVREEAMICMTNFARAAFGLEPLSEVKELDDSALAKAGDVLRCGFSHFACDREFTFWIRAAGYIGESCWRAGENLAWGAGEYGSVRSIFRAWMDSPTHRQNLLGDYEHVGVGVLSGDLEGHAGAQVWAAHFGSHCEG
jgi:uncharacterized protein YkwD